MITAGNSTNVDQGLVLLAAAAQFVLLVGLLAYFVLRPTRRP